MMVLLRHKLVRRHCPQTLDFFELGIIRNKYRVFRYLRSDEAITILDAMLLPEFERAARIGALYQRKVAQREDATQDRCGFRA